jgi:hypothetical protein
MHACLQAAAGALTANLTALVSALGSSRDDGGGASSQLQLGLGLGASGADVAAYVCDIAATLGSLVGVYPPAALVLLLGGAH